jgi:hypothetical protein
MGSDTTPLPGPVTPLALTLTVPPLPDSARDKSVLFLLTCRSLLDAAIKSRVPCPVSRVPCPVLPFPALPFLYPTYLYRPPYRVPGLWCSSEPRVRRWTRQLRGRLPCPLPPPPLLPPLARRTLAPREPWCPWQWLCAQPGQRGPPWSGAQRARCVGRGSRAQGERPLGRALGRWRWGVCGGGGRGGQCVSKGGRGGGAES